MGIVKIFCEGVTDQVFIADCLEIFYSIETERIEKKPFTRDGKDEIRLEIKKKDVVEIIEVGGCSRLSDVVYSTQLLDNEELGGINVVIFDADFTGMINGNKGLESCKTKLNSIKSKNGVNFEYYIWPNNKSDGVIETLLRQLIPLEKEPIFDCIEKSQICLQSCGIPNLKYSNLDLKDKIRFYLHYSHLKSEERNRDYKVNQFWNLDFNNITDLYDLKKFLDSFFVK